MSRGGALEGGAVVLDVAQLEALFTRTFSIGLDVGRGREKVALVWRDDQRLEQAGSGPAASRPPSRWPSSCHRCRQATILARQLPSGTGIVSRDAAFRASWASAIVMTASVRMSSSGSPGKLAAGGG
jgi:hypothetical protein